MLKQKPNRGAIRTMEEDLGVGYPESLVAIATILYRSKSLLTQTFHRACVTKGPCCSVRLCSFLAVSSSFLFPAVSIALFPMRR